MTQDRVIKYHNVNGLMVTRALGNMIYGSAQVHELPRGHTWLRLGKNTGYTLHLEQQRLF